MTDPGDECECEKCQGITDAEAVAIIADFQRRMLDGAESLPADIARLLDEHFWDLI